MSVAKEGHQAHWGPAGFCFGVSALIAAVMLTSGMMAPEPDQSIGTTLGEIARDIRLAATGVSKDAAPVAEPSGMDVIGLLVVVTPILAAIATVLGGISLFRLEPTALP